MSNEKISRKSEKEILALRHQNQELEQKCAELRHSLDIISQAKNHDQRETDSHLETMRLVQQENYNLNQSLQDLRNKISDFDNVTQLLRRDKQQLTEKITDVETRNISALRQERLKLEQAKRDLEQMEEKAKTSEGILAAQNIKYETLYKKYKDLKEAHQKNLEQCDVLKQVAKSFEGRGSEILGERSLRHRVSDSTSPGPSDSRRGARTFEYGDPRKKHVKVTHNEEVFLEELEDLKLQLLTGDVRIATERRAFDELMAQKNDEIEDLQSVD